jgi:hypothetical protein
MAHSGPHQPSLLMPVTTLSFWATYQPVKLSPLPLCHPEPTAKDLSPGRKAQGLSKVLRGSCSELAEGRRMTRSRDARFSSIIHHSADRG